MSIIEIHPHTTIGRIVRHNYNTSRLFEKKQIDYCCGGEKTLEQACKDSSVDLNEFIREINRILVLEDWDSQYLNGLSPGALCDYIVNRHHQYVQVNAPLIRLRLKKLMAEHFSDYSPIFEISRLFHAASDHLYAHIKKEELLFFPFIKSLYKSMKQRSTIDIHVPEMMKLIQQLQTDHEAEGQRFYELARLTDQYSAPEGSCHTFEVTFRAMEDFEKDLHRHIHLENNVLFPRILLMIQIQ